MKADPGSKSTKEKQFRLNGSIIFFGGEDSDKREYIKGDDRDQIIYGLDGNEKISAGGGNDKIWPGSGISKVKGGEGVTRLSLDEKTTQRMKSATLLMLRIGI